MGSISQGSTVYTYKGYCDAVTILAVPLSLILIAKDP